MYIIYLIIFILFMDEEAASELICIHICNFKVSFGVQRETSATKGRPISSGRVNFKDARRGGSNLIPSLQCIVKCPAMCT